MTITAQRTASASAGLNGSAAHPLGHHEAGIEAQAEVANDGVVFLLVLPGNPRR